MIRDQTISYSYSKLHLVMSWDLTTSTHPQTNLSVSELFQWTDKTERWLRNSRHRAKDRLRNHRWVGNKSKKHHWSARLPIWAETLRRIKSCSNRTRQLKSSRSKASMLTNSSISSRGPPHHSNRAVTHQIFREWTATCTKIKIE